MLKGYGSVSFKGNPQNLTCIGTYARRNVNGYAIRLSFIHRLYGFCRQSCNISGKPRTKDSVHYYIVS